MKNTTRAQRTVTLPEDVYEALMQGKQISIERQGQQFMFRRRESKEPSSASKDYAARTRDKTCDELLHEGKREPQRVLEDQGIAFFVNRGKKPLTDVGYCV